MKQSEIWRKKLRQLETSQAKSNLAEFDKLSHKILAVKIMLKVAERREKNV